MMKNRNKNDIMSCVILTAAVLLGYVFGVLL